MGFFRNIPNPPVEDIHFQKISPRNPIKTFTTPWNFPVSFFPTMEFLQVLEFSRFFPSIPLVFQNLTFLEFSCPQQGGGGGVIEFFLEKPNIDGVNDISS